MKNMKKVIAGLLLVTVLCGVTACWDNNTTNNKNDSATTEDRNDTNRDTNRDDGIIEDTGREIKADIIYMLEDYSGLEEGWCILGIKVRPEEKRS